jgi:hypothetical protein
VQWLRTFNLGGHLNLFAWRRPVRGMPWLKHWHSLAYNRLERRLEIVELWR